MAVACCLQKCPDLSRLLPTVFNEQPAALGQVFVSVYNDLLNVLKAL
jgi:hypothetical protein